MTEKKVIAESKVKELEEQLRQRDEYIASLEARLGGGVRRPSYQPTQQTRDYSDTLNDRDNGSTIPRGGPQARQAPGGEDDFWF